jgi:hypothetical protein
MKKNKFTILICLLVGNITVLTGSAEQTELQKKIREVRDKTFSVYRGSGEQTELQKIRDEAFVAILWAEHVNRDRMNEINAIAKKNPFSESAFQKFSPELHQAEQMLEQWGTPPGLIREILQPHKVNEKSMFDLRDPRNIFSSDHHRLIVSNREDLKKIFDAASKTLKERKLALAAGETKKFDLALVLDDDFTRIFPLNRNGWVPGAEPIDHLSVSDRWLHLVLREEMLAWVKETAEKREELGALAAEDVLKDGTKLVAALRAAADAKEQMALQGAAAAAKS